MESESVNNTDHVNHDLSSKSLCTSSPNNLKTSVNADLCDIPSKKRRRSSVRRKSLFETLQSLPGTPNKNVAKEQSKQHDNCSTIPKDAVLPSSSSSSEQVDSNQDDCNLENVEIAADVKFVLDWHSSLAFEASEWPALFKELKAKASRAKETAVASILECELSDSNNTTIPMSSSCEKYESELVNLKKRYALATACISQCIKQAQDMRKTQENRLSRTMTKVANSFKTDRKNPIVILEKIGSLTELLPEDNLSTQNLT